ncbi:hypothetical protein STENM36S_08047 [Streptomyces tendae]
MTAFADRWGLGPDKYWLRGRLPEEKVAFDEALGVWQVAGYPEVLEVLNDSESFSADSTRLFDVDEEQARLIKGDMAQMNGPERIHMRRQVGRAFSPKRMVSTGDFGCRSAQGVRRAPGTGRSGSRDPGRDRCSRSWVPTAPARPRP